MPKDPELIYFLGASCLARLASDAREDGEIAARVVSALGAVSKEVAVWTVDAALARTRRSEALTAFEEHLRGGGSQILVDVLRLGRFAREGAAR